VSTWTVLNIVLEGTADDVVIVTNIEAHVTTWRPPLAGTFIPPPGAGAFDRRIVSVTLEDPPTIKLRPNDVTGVTWDFPLRVSRADPELFVVDARAPRCDCSWYLTISYDYHSQRRVLRFPSATSRTLRTTSPSAAIPFGKYDRGWSW